MAIRSVGDVLAAYEAGRWHTSRFLKNAAAGGSDGQWWDWAYAGGQPAFNARIGAGLAFTPQVAEGNDAIFIPPIAAGQERRLAGYSARCLMSGNNCVSVNGVLYDLLGYYPLIDGDSTDVQIMDNTLTLPRYADGRGVQAVLVNHIVPTTAGGGTHTMVYVDDQGVERSVLFGMSNNGQNRVITRDVGGSNNGNPLVMSLAGGSRGIRSVTSVQLGTALGGYLCIYLVKPLVNGLLGYQSPLDVSASEFVTVEKCLCTANAWNLPIIYDGAHLGWFYQQNGGTRTLSQLFGDLTFIWG